MIGKTYNLHRKYQRHGRQPGEKIFSESPKIFQKVVLLWRLNCCLLRPEVLSPHISPEYGPVAAVLSPRRQAVKCPRHLVSERHRRRETPPGCCSKLHSFSRWREARSLATLLSSAGVLAVFLLLLDLEVTGQTLKLLSKVAICCHRKGVLPRLGVLLPCHHAAMNLHPPYVDHRKGDPSRVAAPSESRRKLATLVITKLAEKSFTYCCYAAS